MNKRKTTTAIVAGVTAVALLLGGTFAWTSISQTAKNESAGIVNVGGRLHDDFDGNNKDVYVENFTDPLNGGQPIYARVRLDEYMEVGKEAGQTDNADRDAVPVVENTSIDDVNSWTPHVPSDSCAVCATEGTCKIHDHWKWEMGGSTTFMPTFNKDKDSLKADINGTYAGTNPNDKVYYDDYVEYTTDETDTEKVYSETETAYYDNDPDMEPNEVEGQYTTKEETHYAKATADAEVITMATWLAPTEEGGKGGVPGNYWVYDTDGWAYWANPIMPGEATGLLLSNIDMFQNPGEKCYYSINVVGQFATVNDWEKFGVDETDEDYPSENAIALLTKASENVPTVTVTNQDGITLVKRGEEVTFSATTAIGAVSAAADDEYNWVVLDENRQVTTSSAVTDNGDGTATLTVGSEELNPGLYVAAHSKNHGGAVGLSAVAVQIYNVTITEESNTTVAKAGTSLNFNASVVDGSTGDAEPSGVTWSVIGQSADTTTDISDDGVLTIDANEQGATVLTVTATSVNGSFVNTYTVTVADKYTVEISMAEDNDIDPGDKLTFTAAVTKNGEADTTSGVNWTVSGGNGSSSISDGVLTIGESEQGATTFTVTATSKGDGEVSDTYTVTVSDQYAVTVTSQLHIDLSNSNGVYKTVYMDSPTTVYADDVLTFSARVTKNGAYYGGNSAVTWSVSGGDVTINTSGQITVPASVAHNTAFTVTATSNADNTVVGTYPLTAYDGYTRLKEIEPGTLETIKIDGMRWYTLAKEDGNALIWAAQVTLNKYENYFYGGGKCAGPWESSEARSYLNGEFYDSLTVLGSKAVETTITTADDYNRNSYTDTQDKVFLPTEADLFGTTGSRTTSDVRDYTLGKTGLIIADEGMRKAIDGEDSWLRSPGNYSATMPQLQGAAGTLYFWQYATKLRPAMWVDITE